MLPAPRDPLDLFAWPEQQAIAALERRRNALRAEIQSLKPRTAKRLWKEQQLRELTLEELRLDIDLQHRKPAR